MTPINIKEINKEVYYSTDKIIRFGKKEIQLLKDKALNNERKRSRLCTHKEIEDKLHEMFIVLSKNVYIRPHKHLHKSESLSVIEGTAYAIFFDEKGKITEIIKMEDNVSGDTFYYRINNSQYHTLFIVSDFFVFHETVNGPFNKSETIQAPWAPDEDDVVAQKNYMGFLENSINNFSSQNKKHTKIMIL